MQQAMGRLKKRSADLMRCIFSMMHQTNESVAGWEYGAAGTRLAMSTAHMHLTSSERASSRQQ